MNKEKCSSSTSKSSVKSSVFSFRYESPTWYHNFPIEVLINIFKYFSEDELLKHIAPVCRHWRYASLKPELWKKFFISGNKVPTRFICRRIKELTFLESVHLNTIADPVVAVRQICRCLPDLKHLAIRNCTTVPESALRNLIHCCKNLESIDLSGTKFKAHRFYEEIAGLINLKSVNLSKNCCFSVPNLMSVVLNCRRLEELRLSSFCPVKPLEQLSDEDVSFVISNLAPDLKSLTLDTSTLTNFSFQTIIMHCNKLERLGLYGARNLSSEIFTKIWKYLTKLKVLKIRHAHQITGQNISELFVSGKQVMQQIFLIDFSGCWKITEEGMEAIANCCENLELLGLKSCKSIRSLQAIHDKCTKLKRLNIAFCTNLDLQTVLPLSDKISTLITDKSEKFADFTAQLAFEKPNLRIKVCLSEYNRQMEPYIPNA